MLIAKLNGQVRSWGASALGKIIGGKNVEEMGHKQRPFCLVRFSDAGS